MVEHASQLSYAFDESMRSHDYAAPHVEARHRLHGGFDADGNHLFPRTLVRGPAIEAMG